MIGKFASSIPNLLHVYPLPKLKYDLYRFWEGRKLWANFMALSRNLARICWGSNPNAHNLEDGSPNQAAIQAKERLIRLTIALATATKHHLRHEPGANYPDLVHLLPPEFVERVSASPTENKKPLIAGTIGARNLPIEITHLMQSQLIELRDKVLHTFIGRFSHPKLKETGGCRFTLIQVCMVRFNSSLATWFKPSAAWSAFPPLQCPSRIQST